MSRNKSGYRDYGPAEEQLAKRIRMLSDAGLKLDAIRTLLPCVLSDLPELELCDEVRATLTREIGDMDERIACLQSSREVLAGYLGKDTRQKVRIGSRS